MPETIRYHYSVHSQYADIAIILLHKDILGGNEALGFTSTLHELIDKNIKHVIIDMKDVEMINSSGLGMLVSGLSTLKKQTAEMILVNVPSKVAGLLEMTHLDKVFRIFGSIDEATKKLI